MHSLSPLTARTTLCRILGWTASTLSATVGLVGCATESNLGNNSTAPRPETALEIVTTTLPVTDFTKAVVGNRAEVIYLMPPNVSPHDFQARPEDVQKIAQADVLVENGLGLETYLDSLIHNAGNQKLTVIDSSKGIEPIAQAAEAHSDTTANATDGHAHAGESNPHLWLDPTRAIQQVETIRDGLIAIDPQGKANYTANAAVYIEKLKALDAEIANTLKPYVGKTFVTYHDFAPYFAQRYSLKPEFLVGVPEENPAPADVKRVMDAVKASELKTLLTEPQAAGNPFDALAKDLNVNVSSFDPMETAGANGLEPDYYLTTMRQNVKNLEAAFQGEPERSALPIWQFQPRIATTNRF
ncbi:MAG TPA: zinc ABC transporter substrate-binding protein [Trichocoleus sp.]